MVGRTSWWWSPWWTVIASPVPVALLFWAVIPPGGSFGALVGAGLSALAVGAAWLTVAGVAVVVLPRPRLRHAVRLWPFLLVPALLAAALVVAGTGVVPRAAFDAHRSGFEALVAEAAPGGRIEGRRVGLFTVDVTGEGLDGCTMLTSVDYHSAGWAHCPDHVPVNAEGDGYRYDPIEGPWYRFRFEW
ncbi:hypothetical protein IOD16_15060 [Saccharothrix sp. 6-C]|uniref:hypothetical protein n=1 Tax=Saccharothrix sp. 6-C TaxID=2781735 RepID=UPI001916CD65|nr:hypothetical protein [Saccharothrix sp. 6-C]QQQ79596.1 hypothetical protein IOD16_15060 [Saccharothrix sp. 6-C]